VKTIGSVLLLVMLKGQKLDKQSLYIFFFKFLVVWQFFLPKPKAVSPTQTDTADDLCLGKRICPLKRCRLTCAQRQLTHSLDEYLYKISTKCIFYIAICNINTRYTGNLASEMLETRICDDIFIKIHTKRQRRVCKRNIRFVWTTISNVRKDCSSNICQSYYHLLFWEYFSLHIYHLWALILSETLALYKSFTYLLLTYITAGLILLCRHNCFHNEFALLPSSKSLAALVRHKANSGVRVVYATWAWF